MELAVEQVLAERQQSPWRRLGRAGFAVALILHAGTFAAAMLLPHLLPPEPPQTPQYVAVEIVPLQALGRPEPPPPEVKPRPAPRDEPPPPPPPALPEPKPVQPPPPDPALPVLPAPKQTKPEPPPAPAPVPIRQGTEQGSTRGTATFGASAATFDNPDFTYGYYIDRMVASISTHWTRPPVGAGVECAVHFRIDRQGNVSELELVRSSEFPAFDQAALRAVRTASPLPPLPAGYRHESLGVTLQVQ